MTIFSIGLSLLHKRNYLYSPFQKIDFNCENVKKPINQEKVKKCILTELKKFGTEPHVVFYEPIDLKDIQHVLVDIKDTQLTESGKILYKISKQYLLDYILDLVEKAIRAEFEL